MSSRVDMIEEIYEKFDEDSRLVVSRNGQLEYATTMEFIHQYAKKGMRILEVGAGTGRYSVQLAKEGYEVSAIELVEKNLEILREKITEDMILDAMQGDALDLSRFSDETFDVTMVFGPLYHIYDKKDVNTCIEEAMRVTKKDGVILFAFISVYGIMQAEFHTEAFSCGLDINFTEDYKVKHEESQIFTGYDIVEFEELFSGKSVEHLTTVAVDGILESLRRRSDFYLSDEDFERYKKYHLAICEKRELLGSSNHLLYICRKK